MNKIDELFEELKQLLKDIDPVVYLNLEAIQLTYKNRDLSKAINDAIYPVMLQLVEQYRKQEKEN